MRAMRTLLVTLSVAGLVLAQAPATAAPAQPKPTAARPKAGRIPASYKNLKYPPMNDIKVPEPTRFELPNGIVVYLVEDHELPMTSVSALIRTGSRWEPAGKAGLASITGEVMRTGGSKTRNGDKLDEELDRLGAYVETGIGDESGNATVSVLREDIDKGLDILADLLQNPAFPEDKIELAKVQQRDGIARRNDDARGIVFREFPRLIYGRDTAYGRIPEYATIESIQRDDLVKFHEQFFEPENVILGAWGDFKAGEMRAKLERAFGGWNRGGKPKPQAPEVAAEAKNRAGLYFIDKDDVNQSTVIMGFLGGQRNDPDFYALTVMNSVLGGGFASRLFSNVRSEEGLAYNVGSNWDAGWDRPGVFRAVGGTKSETTVRIINSIKRELARISEAEVTDLELSRAKDSILKGFAFEFDSTGKIVNRLMTYEYYGYPRDYLQQYRANIDKVTRADVLRVAKQYIDNDKLAILVLGNEKEFKTPLTSLGKVAAVDITIPAPKGAAIEAATPESIEKGKAMLTSVRKAMGGEAIAKVQDYTLIADTSFETPQGAMGIKMEVTTNLSGKVLQKMATPMGEMVTGFDGQAGWMKMGPNTRDVPSSQIKEMQKGIATDTLALLRDFDKPAFTVQAIGDSVVAISDPARGMTVTLTIDPDSNLIAKKAYTAAIMGPPAEIEESYSDYREISGVKLPFKSVMNRAGKKFGEMTATEVKINPGVPDEAYKKPAK